MSLVQFPRARPPAPRPTRIPRPPWARPGERLIVVRLDPSYWRFACFAVARPGEYADGCPHAVRLPSGVLVRVVRAVAGGYSIAGELYPARDAELLGRVREFWVEHPAERPDAARWVLEEPSRAAPESHPLLWLNLNK